MHNLCKDIWKTDGRTDGQVYATTIPLCQNWPGVIKNQMAFHNYQSGLLFVCMPMYLLLTAGQMLWYTTVIIIFVNFAALSECSFIRVLSKLFIYNGAFTTAWFKPRWLISNEIRYADYQFRWNIFCDKTKLDLKKSGRNWTRKMKWNYFSQLIPCYCVGLVHLMFQFITSTKSIPG